MAGAVSKFGIEVRISHDHQTSHSRSRVPVLVLLSLYNYSMTRSSDVRYQNADGNRALRRIQGFIFWAIFRSRWVATRISTLGEIAGYFEWLRLNSVDNIAVYREDLWHFLASDLQRRKVQFSVFELGVAWGYLTNWWIKNEIAENIVEWNGFDRFTGLPRAWRRFPAGFFDASGLPPKGLNDDRINWYIGDVEDTIHHINFEKYGNSTKIIFFDLDIYEPSIYAFNIIEPFLNSGDYLYFDEAYDPDERKIINDRIVGNPKYSFTMASPTAILIQVT